MKNSFEHVRETRIVQEDINYFGEFLKSARISNGKSKNVIAKELGIKAYSITNWEKGITFPTEDKLSSVVIAYGVKLEELRDIWSRSKSAREDEVTTRKILKHNSTVARGNTAFDQPTDRGHAVTGVAHSFKYR